MDNYFITWAVEIDAESFEDAALQALGIQRDPLSIATCFKVQSATTRKIKHLDVEDINNIQLLGQ